MRKLMYLFLTCGLLAHTALAQTITDRDITGNWEMVGFDMSGINWDFRSDVLSLSADMEKEFALSDKQQIIANLKRTLAPYKSGNVIIKPNQGYEQTLMGETAKGTYSIVKQGNENFLKVINDDDQRTVEMLKVQLTNNIMHLSMPSDDGSVTLLSFSRTK
jgi:hypothetical protein